MYVLGSTKPAEPVQNPDIYIETVDQSQLTWPSPTRIYATYALNLLGFLAGFYLLVNQVVKVKKA